MTTRLADYYIHIRIFWLVVIVTIVALIYRHRNKIGYKIRESVILIRNRFGGHISLNNSFTDDLESGLASRHFDIISQNRHDDRGGLDAKAKDEIKAIMETEHLTFDKARLLYTERKFGQNGIAPDGTPIDPKAVTFGS
ncbi:Fungal protein of unknown function (DUF2015) [Nakaseomyces glabratus]|nr:Fungal protein of unknown function (DUF2015) [Nakaseomyces glabratus]